MDGKDYDNDDNQEGMLQEGFATLIPTTASNEVPDFNVGIKNVIKKVRKVVKTFRKSPVKNDVLKEICAAGTKEGVVTCARLQNSMELNA